MFDRSFTRCMLRQLALPLTIIIGIRILETPSVMSFEKAPPLPLQNNAQSTSNFDPTWVIREDVKPYMGNLTCPFEIAHWNLESFYSPTDLSKRRNCGKLQYIPHEGYVPPNALAIFDKVANGTTIYFIGDSMTCQSGADFLCLMASVSEVTRKNIGRLPAKSWCNDANECEVNFNGFTGWQSVHATFRSLGPRNKTDIHVVAAIEYGRVGELTRHLNSAKKGDIYVISQGLHKRRDKGHDFLLNSFKESQGALVSAKDKGAKLIFRETTAAHFHTPDGYHASSVVPSQRKGSATCVPPFMFDREKSRKWDDTGLVSLMKSLNISILEAWEASFLAPEWCHVGQGKDCLHWLQPGPTSYISEALLNYIFNDL